MAKMNFKSFGKDAGTIAMEAGIIGGGAILSAKFLDFNTMFKKKIEADPAFAEKWFIKHQGAVKAGGAIAIGAAFWSKMPNWAKLAFVGLAVQGVVQEVGVLATGKDGVKFFEPIGQNARGGADTAALEALLRDAAAMGTNPTNEFPTGVSGAGDPNPSVDLERNASTAVSGFGMGGPDDFGNF